jgi:hypothetical protein
MCHVRLRTTIILMTCFVLFGLTAVDAAAQQAVSAADAECINKAYEVTPGAPVKVTIKYHLTEKCTTKRLTERVDDSMAVLVTLKNFNFVNYAVKYTVDDTVIESYVTLERLWSQIFGIASLVQRATEARDARAKESGRVTTCGPKPVAGDFLPCVTEWFFAIEKEAQAVETDAAANARKIALDDDAVKAVGETSAKHGETRKSISDKRLRVLESTPQTPQDVEWFQEVQAQHDKVMARSTAYSSLASLTANGQLKVLPKNKPGHIITLTLAPRSVENKDADAAAPLVVEYVVQSRFPLVFHVGYGFSRLKDVEFEKVRSLSNQDLFSVVKANKNTAGMVAYLSYGLWKWQAAGTEQGFLLTLATDFKDPGDRLLVGGSLRVWKKLFVTAGAMSGSVKEGVNPIVETIGGQVGARELFGSVSTRRDWQPHFGISFSVF